MTVNRVVGVAMLCATAAALPLLLCGGLVILMQRDLAFDAADLGTGVAAFFGLSALVAVPVGRAADRLGPQVTTRAGLLLSASASLGIGAASREWWHVVALLALAGVGNALTQLGVNLLVARGISPGRYGLAYGTKQAAVPLASLLAGLAVPAIGLSVGWRWAFIAAAGLGLVMTRAIPHRAWPSKAAEGAPVRDARRMALVILAAGAGLGTIGGNCAAAFTVASLVAHGFDTSIAGYTLAAGSALGISVRVGSGWLADRVARGSLLIVVALIGIGIAGFGMLALALDNTTIVLGTLMAFGGGWGFAGLILLAVARTNPTAPAAAMGIVQVGPMLGSVVGPIAFGRLATDVSYAAAWWLMAVLATTGIILILWSRRVLLAGRVGPTDFDQSAQEGQVPRRPSVPEA